MSEAVFTKQELVDAVVDTAVKVTAVILGSGATQINLPAGASVKDLLNQFEKTGGKVISTSRGELGQNDVLQDGETVTIARDGANG